jgi:hypothetical protein
VVHADVADEDRVRGQGAVDLDGGALGVERPAVVAEARRNQLVPVAAIAIDL